MYNPVLVHVSTNMSTNDYTLAPNISNKKFKWSFIWFGSFYFTLQVVISENLLISDSLLCLSSFGEFFMQVIISMGSMNSIISFDKVGMMHLSCICLNIFPLSPQYISNGLILPLNFIEFVFLSRKVYMYCFVLRTIAGFLYLIPVHLFKLLSFRQLVI